MPRSLFFLFAFCFLCSPRLLPAQTVPDTLWAKVEALFAGDDRLHPDALAKQLEKHLPEADALEARRIHNALVEVYLASANCIDAAERTPVWVDYIIDASRWAEQTEDFDHLAILDATLAQLDSLGLGEGQSAGEIHLEQAFYYNTILGDYATAKELYSKAKQYQIRRDFRYASYTLKPLANIYTRLGDTERAIAVLSEALDTLQSSYRSKLPLRQDSIIWEELLWEIVPEVAYVYLDLGKAQETAGQDTEAYSSYLQGKKWLRMASSELEAPVSRFILPEFYLTGLQAEWLSTHGKQEEAKRLLEPYLKKEEVIAIPPLAAQLRTVLAEVYRLEGDYQEAERYLRKARQVLCQYYEERAGSCNRREVAKLELALSDLFHEKGEARPAIDWAHQALQRLLPAFPKQGVPQPDWFYPENTLFEGLTAKADAYWLQYEQSQGSLPLRKAQQNYELAIAAEEVLAQELLYESSRRQLREGRFAESRQQLMKVLLAQRRSRQNLLDIHYCIEKSKALLLRRRLNTAEALKAALSGSLVPPALLEEEGRIRRVLYEQRAKLSATGRTGEVLQSIHSLTERHQALLKNIISADTALYQLYYSDQTPSLSELQDQLPHNTLLLNFFFGEDRVVVLSATESGRASVHTARRTEVERATRQLLQQLRDENGAIAGGQSRSPKLFNDFCEPAWQLYQMLVAPALEGRGAPAYLVFIPDGILHELPFELLLAGEAKKKPTAKNLPGLYAELPYLFRKQHCAYAHSATLFTKYTLAEVEGSGAAGQSFLGIAPDYTACQGTWEPTVAGQAVVNQIAESGWGEAWTSQQAALAHRFKTELRGRELSSLYFHGHIAVDQSDPLNSSLVFSCGAEDSIGGGHKLRMVEVLGMKLDVDLLALIGCGSGLGKFVSGEGLINLERAFRFAGARHIIIGRWDLDDKASAELCELFFDRLRQGKPYLQSLQKARLEFLRKQPMYAHPYFWGGLSQVGGIPALESESRETHPPNYLVALLLVGVMSFVAWRYRKA